MKILYHHRVASKDGQFVHIEGLVHALRKLGHEVMIVGPDFVQKQGFGGEARGVRWLKRWIPRPIYELAELGYSIPAGRRLSKAVRTFHPDVIYERYNLFFLAGLWIKRRHRIPWIVEVNSPLFDERSAYGGIKLKRLARWTERSVWRAADHVFAVTDVLARRIEQEGVPRRRITVTPNGIQPESFAHLPAREDAKKLLGFEGILVLGFTGFVREWHGLERVLDAMQTVRVPTHLLLVGDGPARAMLEQRAHTAGLGDRITFTGIVDRTQVIGFINAFDIALQPNVVAYASPLKLFEYMAAGCAVVAPDQPNIREVLSDNVDALLFDPNTRDAFPDCVARLADDAALRAQLGRAAQRTLHARNLTWDANAARVVRRARLLTGATCADNHDAAPDSKEAA
jgi:glycosyltransferase involved in cell wall biosynthesis